MGGSIDGRRYTRHTSLGFTKQLSSLANDGLYGLIAFTTRACDGRAQRAQLYIQTRDIEQSTAHLLPDFHLWTTNDGDICAFHEHRLQNATLVVEGVSDLNWAFLGGFSRSRAGEVGENVGK